MDWPLPMVADEALGGVHSHCQWRIASADDCPISRKRGRSSVGMSACLADRRSWVRAPPAPFDSQALEALSATHPPGTRESPVRVRARAHQWVRCYGSTPGFHPESEGSTPSTHNADFGPSATGSQPSLLPLGRFDRELGPDPEACSTCVAQGKEHTAADGEMKVRVLPWVPPG